MDKDVFKNQMLGAAKSMAISTSTAVVSGAINSLSGAKFGGYTTPGQGGTQTGWYFSDSKVLNKLSSTMVSVGQMAGSISGQLVSAAMGDGFSLNVLNSKDLGLGGNSTGLLQLTIGGKNSGFKIGQGGADISLGAINQFMAGVGELKDRADVRDLYGGDANAVLAQANMMRWSGNASAMAIANQIMSGGVGVGYSDGVNTAMGNLMVLDRNAIKLDSDKSGDLTLESQLQLATLGSHEGQHIIDNLTGNAAYTKPVLNGGNINVLRELAAHGTGVNVWENLTGMFGTPQGSDSSKFVDEMSKLVAANNKGPGAFASYVTGTYDMTGDDWRYAGSGNNKHNAVLDSDASLKSLYIALQTSENQAGKDAIRNGLIEKMKSDGIDIEGLSADKVDEKVDEYLKKMNEGQSLSLVYNQQTGQYSLGAGGVWDDTARILQAGLLAQGMQGGSAGNQGSGGESSLAMARALAENPVLLATLEVTHPGLAAILRQGSVAMSGQLESTQLKNDIMRGIMALEGLPYTFGGGHSGASGRDNYGNENGPGVDCSGGITSAMRDPLFGNLPGLPVSMNAQYLYDHITGTSISPGSANFGSFGDMYFVGSGSNPSANIEHVGMFLGNGKVLNAWGNTDRYPDYNPSPSGNRILDFKRVLDGTPQEKTFFYKRINFFELLKKYGRK